MKYLLLLFFFHFFSLEARPLRIFYPFSHREATKSFSQACDYLGHTVLLPGLSFSKETSKMYISYFAKAYDEFGPSGFFTKLKLKALYPELTNIEVVEVEDLINNPPDVIFITCKDQEDDVLKHIWPLFCENGKTKLAYSTGLNWMPYRFDTMKNILLTDATTIEYVKKHKVPHFVTWIQWIDWDFFPFQGPSDLLQLGSYIIWKHYPEGYKLSMSIRNIKKYLTLFPIDFKFNEKPLQ